MCNFFSLGLSWISIFKIWQLKHEGFLSVCNHSMTMVMQKKNKRGKKPPTLMSFDNSQRFISPVLPSHFSFSQFHFFFTEKVKKRSNSLILWYTPHDYLCFLFVLTWGFAHWIVSGVNHLGPTVFQGDIHLDSLMSLLCEPDSGRCCTTIFTSPICLNHIFGHIHYLLILVLAFVKTDFRSSDTPMSFVKVSASSVFSIPTSYYFIQPCPLHKLSQ